VLVPRRWCSSCLAALCSPSQRAACGGRAPPVRVCDLLVRPALGTTVVAALTVASLWLLLMGSRSAELLVLAGALFGTAILRCQAWCWWCRWCRDPAAARQPADSRRRPTADSAGGRQGGSAARDQHRAQPPRRPSAVPFSVHGGINFFMATARPTVARVPKVSNTPPELIRPPSAGVVGPGTADARPGFQLLVPGGMATS
jgi:hypothetical protein